MEKLLIVGDVPEVRNKLRSGLGGEYTIIEGADRREAMALFVRHTPKVVALDLGLSSNGQRSVHGDVEQTPASDRGGDGQHNEGFLCLDSMVESRPCVKIVVLTEGGQPEAACRAVGRGAYDFYPKPIDLDLLKITIGRAFHLSSLEEQSGRLHEALARSSAGIGGIAGQCAAMQELLDALQVVPSLVVPPLVAPNLVVPEREKVRSGIAEEHQMSVEAALLQAIGEGRPESFNLREGRDRVEKGMIAAAVGRCRGNMAKASELLGVSRSALYDLMKKHGLFKQENHRS